MASITSILRHAGEPSESQCIQGYGQVQVLFLLEMLGFGLGFGFGFGLGFGIGLEEFVIT